MKIMINIIANKSDLVRKNYRT